MLDLTTVSIAGKGKAKGSKSTPYVIVPFTKPFKLDGVPVHAFSRGTGRHGAYLDFAEQGEKLLWIKYHEILYQQLKDWPIKLGGGCHVAENSEGKYIVLTLPKDCRMESISNYKQAEKVYNHIIWAPIGIIEELRKRLDQRLFHYAAATEYVTPEEVKFGNYFQIFHDIWSAKVACPFCEKEVEIQHNGTAPAKPLSPNVCPHCNANVMRYQTDVLPESGEGKLKDDLKGAEIKFKDGNTGYVIFDRTEEQGKIV